MALTITSPSLKQVTIAVLTAGLAERDLLPTPRLGVIPNSPDDWAELPVVTVQQLSDGESFSHIGDSLADQYIGDDTEVTAGQSALFTQVVEVRVWSKKSAERDRLGDIVKQELFRGRGTSDAPGLFISTDGLDLPKITGGHDEDINDTSKEFAPYPLYCRTYVMSALSELTIQHTAGEAISQIDVFGDGYEQTLEDLSEE
jgi:hypothetical protein